MTGLITSHACFPLPAWAIPGGEPVRPPLLRRLRERFPWVFWNSGGPRSRTRSVWIQSSMLSDQDLLTRWERVGIVSISAHRGIDLVTRVYDALEQSGFETPEEAIASLPGLPAEPLHCLPIGADVTTLPSSRRSGESLLFDALVLGRCSSTFFDPDKPVIWTNSRLRRTLALFRPGSFYDDL